MWYQVIIAVCLTGFAVNLYFNLRHLRRPLVKAMLPEKAPLVSILIPARNEETNIQACLESLLQQDYPDLEILVLDDEEIVCTRLKSSLEKAGYAVEIFTDSREAKYRIEQHRFDIVVIDRLHQAIDLSS